MKKTIYYIKCLVIILFMQCCSSSRIVNKNHILTGTIVYKRYDIITAESALKGNISFDIGVSEFLGRDLDSVKKKILPENSTHDLMKVIPKYDSVRKEFQIFKDYYWEPYQSRNGSDLDKGKFTDRDSLYQCNKHTKFVSIPCDRKVEIAYQNEDQYKFQFIRDNRKQILGFDCFKVIAKEESKYGWTRFFEMYVTEDILINYHPFMKIKSFKHKYFILDLISYYGDDKGQRTEIKVTSIKITDK